MQGHINLSLTTIPIDRFHTETDGPFVQISKRPAEPKDVGETVKKLADLLQIGHEEISEIVVNNLKRLVSI